jgi:DNA-binding CsgD family transcriptional regulator
MSFTTGRTIDMATPSSPLSHSGRGPEIRRAAYPDVDLDGRELGLVVEAVAILDAAGSSFPHRAVAAARRVVECDRAGYYEVDAGNGRLRLLAAPDEASPASGIAAGRPGSLREWPGCGPAPLDLPNRPASRTTRSDGRDGQAFVQELVLSDEARQRSFIVVERRSSDFTPNERLRLAALRPHLVARQSAVAEAARMKAALGLPFPEEEDCCGPRLSGRELEVMIWVVRGKTNDEVATILGISALTVKKHLEHVFEKLDVTNRVTAALCFASCRLRGSAPSFG